MTTAATPEIIDGMKESWNAGDKAYFEYGYPQDHDSVGVQFWYRSHEEVTVLSREPDEDDGDSNEPQLTLQQRLDGGQPRIYRVRFADGFEGGAFECELYIDSTRFDKAYGPPPTAEQHRTI